MKITGIKNVTCPIESAIRNAFIDFSKMNCSVVAIVTDQYIDGKQIIGYGFNSNGRYSSQGLLNERFIPRLLSASPQQYLDENTNNIDPFKVFDLLMTNEKPGGHGERSVAVGVLDMAIWDIVAKMEQKPLYKVFSERFNNNMFDERIYCYAAGGYYYPDKGIQALTDEMNRYLYDYGYKRIKMKIGGDTLTVDLQRIESVINNCLDGNGNNLKVDANGRFDLDTAIKYGSAMEQYNLYWYEEAGDPLNYKLQSDLSKYYKLPMATGENLFSSIDAYNLLLYGGMRKEIDFLHFDCALSYGAVEYLKTIKKMRELEWNKNRLIPHGGHQMNVHLCSGLQLGGVEIYPDLFQPFGGFPDGTFVGTDGCVIVSDLPGLGYEGKESLYKILKDLTHSL